jgi:transposase
MEKMTQFTIGIDVSKDHLDAHCLPGGAAKRVTNDAAGHRQLLKWLPDVARIARIVFEPTGPYHRTLERKLDEQGMPLAKVNPRQARRFAEATGKLAKTDRLDAAMLARMGVVLEPEVRPAVNESLAALKDLHTARQALIKDRTAAKNRAKSLRVPLLRRQNAQRLKQIDRQLAALDREIAARINADPTLKQRRDILGRNPLRLNHLSGEFRPNFKEKSEIHRSFRIGSRSGEHPRHIANNRREPALRHARTGHPRSAPGRQSRRSGAGDPAIRLLARPRRHSRRPRQTPPGTLYARNGRLSLQSRPQSQVRSPHRRRKTAQSRHNRRHEKAHRPRKRPYPRGANLERKISLSITDTLTEPMARRGSVPNSPTRVSVLVASGSPGSWRPTGCRG